MQLGDNLGFAGIVLGLLCGGLVAAFPNRRSIGFGLIGATLLSAAVWWFVAHHEKHEAEKIRPSVSWVPGPLVEGQPLSATQLNARAFVDGKEIEVENPVYNPTFGSLLSPGSQTISVTLTPRNSALYLPVTQTVTVRVVGRPVSHSAPRAPSPPAAEDPNVALLNRSESLLASFTSWRSTRIADRNQMLERFHKEHDGRFEKDTMDRMEAYRTSEWWAETLAQYRQLYTAELLKDRRELFAVAPSTSPGYALDYSNPDGTGALLAIAADIEGANTQLKVRLRGEGKWNGPMTMDEQLATMQHGDRKSHAAPPVSQTNSPH